MRRTWDQVKGSAFKFDGSPVRSARPEAADVQINSWRRRQMSDNPRPRSMRAVLLASKCLFLYHHRQAQQAKGCVYPFSLLAAP